MKWYTLTNGRLCLGSESKLNNFHVATDIQLNYQVETPLTPDQIQLIGSFPEDWLNDNNIESKINDVAVQLYQDDCMAELDIIGTEIISEKSINECFSELKNHLDFYNKAGFSQISALL